MSSTEEIFIRANDFLGGVSETREAALSAMSASSRAELEARLKDDCEVPEEIFVSAAALLAASMFIQLNGLTAELSSVKLGSLSVSKRGSGSSRSSAAALRAQAEAMLSKWLRDDEFHFQGVRG